MHLEAEADAAAALYGQLARLGPRQRCLASVRDEQRAVQLAKILNSAHIASTTDSFFDGRGSSGLQHRVFVAGADWHKALEARARLPLGWVSSLWGGEE